MVCSGSTHHQVVFRNVHKLLMDTATSEFFFALDFFEDESVFRELLAPIVAVVEQDLAAAVQVNRIGRVGMGLWLDQQG